MKDEERAMQRRAQERVGEGVLPLRLWDKISSITSIVLLLFQLLLR